MFRYLIMCRSLTYAQRASRLLERHGITAAITKLPQSVADSGCSYCVRVNEKNYRSALTILKEAGLNPGKVFRLNEGGEPQEVLP